MTDAEMDARVEALSDADLQDIAANGVVCKSRMHHYRPDALLKRLASEVLRLRADLRVAEANLGSVLRYEARKR